MHIIQKQLIYLWDTRGCNRKKPWVATKEKGSCFISTCSRAMIHTTHDLWECDPTLSIDCTMGHDVLLTERSWFPILPFRQLINFSKKIPSQPWFRGYMLRTYNKLFFSAGLPVVYVSTNSTIHLPFCRKWHRGNKFYNIQRSRLLVDAIPCWPLCFYLLHTHLQAGRRKEDDSRCLAPQVDTNGCNLACTSELFLVLPLNNTMRDDHPSWILLSMLCSITEHSSCHWVVWLLQTWFDYLLAPFETK